MPRAIPKEIKDARVMLCKICNMTVPRRKRYHPKTCEACQKFFRRNFQARAQLQCSGGNNDCAIDYQNRRSCPKCRFSKCVVMGMQSKFTTAASNKSPNSLNSDQISQDSSDTNDSPDSKEVVSYTLAPLVRDPILFDGCAVEEAVKISVYGFTILHGFEFLPLKIYKGPIYNPQIHRELGIKQVEHTVAVGLSYANFMKEFVDFSNKEQGMMLATGLRQMGLTFSSLPNNVNSRFHINKAILPMLLQIVPEYQITLDGVAGLEKAFEEWRPSLIECSLILALEFFNEHVIGSNHRLSGLRRALLAAFNMSYSGGADRDFSRTQVKLSATLAMADSAVNALQRSVEITSARGMEHYKDAERKMINEVFFNSASESALIQQ